MAKQLSKLARDIKSNANGKGEYLKTQGKDVDEGFLLASSTAEYSVLKKVSSEYLDDEVLEVAEELDINQLAVAQSVPYYVEKYAI